ncbi:hypothetical protein [Clostridium grantii]|uniref:Iron complex transport system substrate-binding protein n=1 Tax=Clostridium grantii DSM 8605 TaxID=1121316 RepID=A0A1M5WW68_9CLOT|nr:hypothetical protein [Clostridium grantii]SHH91955.1 iron complex transport system substrate-binding protein [Clostridium grantii DSM 8605]
MNKIRRIITLITTICILAMLAVGCQKGKVENSQGTEGQTVKVIDSRGKEVEVNYPAKKLYVF